MKKPCSWEGKAHKQTIQTVRASVNSSEFIQIMEPKNSVHCVHLHQRMKRKKTCTHVYAHHPPCTASAVSGHCVQLLEQSHTSA